MEPTWKIVKDGSLIGVLDLIEIDQPWFRCRFSPEAGWTAVESLFESMASAHRQRNYERYGELLISVRSLGLTLEPLSEGYSIVPVMLKVEGERASFRY
ncbi:hypothetical protein [Streptomyces sp. NRRL S-241]|uniref:hypothetical protein n=1 Tax=Streptomyces sp. NRRL S-241 TaxID=1463896 RepID=UPI0004BE5E41|nr:hypothetical protein [Streptomyces sp. NRRL S-241]